MPSRVFRLVQTLFPSALVAFAAVALSPGRALAVPGSVTGLVIDTSNQPVAGATVAIAGNTTLTNASGRYLVTSVPAGNQFAKATKSGYLLSVAVPVTVVGSQTVTAPTLSLDSRWATVRGAVMDAATKAPIAGAAVAVAGQKTTTNTYGAYRFNKVPAGGKSVTVAAAGYEDASRAVTVPADHSTFTVDVLLTKKTASPPSPATGPTGPGSLIPWNGSSSYLYGANYAWYNYGTDFGTGGWTKFTDWNAVSAGFAAMKAAGVRITRFWVFGDGRYAPEFNTDGTVAGLDSYVLSDVDRLLQIAANNDIYLLLTVIDGTMWSNGVWAGDVQMGGHAAIVTNATAQQTFLDNALKPLLQRVASSPNKKYVLGYDLVNEPEANMATYWGGVNLSPSQVMTFVKRCADYVHSYGGGAYATVGCATPYYVPYWKNLGLDFYQIHYYPWMDFGNGAGNGLPTYASLGLDRPCIVGEFPNATAGYSAWDTAPLTAKWYLDAIYAKGYAGAITWSFCVSDSATNWGAFQPLFTGWGQSHPLIIGPK